MSPLTRRLSRAMRRFVEHPGTKLSVGIILVITGAVEMYDDYQNGGHLLALKVHHGLIILGIVHLLAGLPDLVEGIEKLQAVLPEEQEPEPKGEPGKQG